MHKIRFFSDARGRSGFTLVELLVSITVLALLLVLTAQLVNSASITITGSNKRTDADSQSRLVFSRLGQDIARLAKRSDVDFSTFKHPEFRDNSNPRNPANDLPRNLQDGSDGSDPLSLDHNDRFAFYSENIGGYTPAGTTSPTTFPSSSRAPLSLLAYQIAAEPNGGAITLRRMAKALGWDPDLTNGAWACPVYLPLKVSDIRINQKLISLFSKDPTKPSTDPSNPDNPLDSDYTTIGDMVFRFEYSYLLKANATNTKVQTAHLSIAPYDRDAVPAHTPTNGFQDVAAIVVTLGILDTTSSAIITKDRSKLIAAFPDMVEDNTTHTVKDALSEWQKVLLAPDFATNAGIPRPAAAAVRLYQRTFYLEPR